MGILSEQLQKKAADKKMDVPIWLAANLKNLPRYRITSHIGRYTNPDVDVDLYDDSNSENMGYVTTSSTGQKQDICADGGAKYIGLASILVKVLENGRTVLENLQDNTSFIRLELQELGIDCDKLRAAVLGIKYAALPDQTDQKLKQVYFPVGAGAYHLLTVLPSSTVMVSLTDKVKAQEEYHYHCYYDKKSADYGHDYEKIVDYALVGFGGAQPQNISCLNRKGGMAVLTSLPPQLAGKQIRLPQKDFFADIRELRYQSDEFKAFHLICQEEHNNVDIRDQMKDVIDIIADNVLIAAYNIRAAVPHWSDHKEKLPIEQKIWLDDAYRQQRHDDKAWLEEVSNEFGRWLSYTYKKKFGKDAVFLADEETRFFSKRMREILLEEVRTGQ